MTSDNTDTTAIGNFDVGMFPPTGIAFPEDIDDDNQRLLELLDMYSMDQDTMPFLSEEINFN